MDFIDLIVCVAVPLFIFLILVISAWWSHKLNKKDVVDWLDICALLAAIVVVGAAVRDTYDNNVSNLSIAILTVAVILFFGYALINRHASKEKEQEAKYSITISGLDDIPQIRQALRDHLDYHDDVVDIGNNRKVKDFIKEAIREKINREELADLELKFTAQGKNDE